MKHILKNNQIIITALAIMIVIVWYLNYTDNDVSVKSGNGTVATTKDAEVYSDVSTTLTENDVDLEALMNEENGLVTVDDSTNVYADISDEDMYIADDGTVQKNEVEVANSTEDQVALDGQESTEDQSAQLSLDDLVYEDGYEDEVSEADSESEVMNVSDTGEVYNEDNSESSAPGEAVLASTTIDSSYFASAKLTREQNRAKEKETLMNMIEDQTISQDAKQQAIDSMLALTNVMEKENATELLLEAKGFDGAVVSIVDSNVDVVINAPTITDQQVAQIESIVKRKTGVSSENIVISPVVVAE